MSKLSVIVPCYNEEESIKYFVEELLNVEKNIDLDFEYIFVNDGSTDKTLEELKRYNSINEKYNYINLSKNFGKESALYAGLENSSGDYVCVMDVDLQDPPYLLEKMYEIITNTRKDVIVAKRNNRENEPILRSTFSKLFYVLMNKLSDVNIVQGSRDFRLMKREVVNSILSVSEYNRFSKGIFNWVGYDTEYIGYDNVERKAGETSWSFWSLFKYSIEGIVNFSQTPLNIILSIGIILSFLSMSFGMFTILKSIIIGEQIRGYTTLITVITFLSGIQLISLGVIGKYVSKIFLETKKRPIYIAKENTLKNKKN